MSRHAIDRDHQIERPHNARGRQSVAARRQNRFEAFVVFECARLLLERVEANLLNLCELSKQIERHIPARIPIAASPDETYFHPIILEGRRIKMKIWNSSRYG